MGLVLVLAPLLLLSNPEAPHEGATTVAAGAASPPAPARWFDARATRSSATARIAAAAVAAPATTAPPVTAPSVTAARRAAAVATTVATTTTTRPPPPPPTTAPPPPTTSPPTAPPTTAAPAPAGHSETGEASWYRGPDGECAHNRAPIGSTIRVTNLDNGRSTTCRVAGRGPYGAGRIVDLTQSTFARVADPDAGVFHARVEW